MLEKTLERPLDCKEIQPVHPKGDQSWVFIGRTDAKAETPILWPPDVKNWLTGKDPDGGKDRKHEEKGMTEDEMVGWHHHFNGHEFCDWWWTGRPGLLQSIGSQIVRHDWATELNWTELNFRRVLGEVKAWALEPACLDLNSSLTVLFFYILDFTFAIWKGTLQNTLRKVEKFIQNSATLTYPAMVWILLWSLTVSFALCFYMALITDIMYFT